MFVRQVLHEREQKVLIAQLQVRPDSQLAGLPSKISSQDLKITAIVPNMALGKLE